MVVPCAPLESLMAASFHLPEPPAQPAVSGNPPQQSAPQNGFRFWPAAPAALANTRAMQAEGQTR